MLIILLLFSSCRCNYSYLYDGGKNFKEKGFKYEFGPAPINSAGIEINIGSDKLFVFRTPYSPLKTVDTVAHEKVIITDLELSFRNGIILKKEIQTDRLGNITESYTCENFKRTIKKNKFINLKVYFKTDNSPELKTQNFVMTRKQTCYFSVH